MKQKTAIERAVDERLYAFTAAMNKELFRPANLAKTPWWSNQCDEDYLKEKLAEHLETAEECKNQKRRLAHLVHAANFIMMLYTNETFVGEGPEVTDETDA